MRDNAPKKSKEFQPSRSSDEIQSSTEDDDIWVTMHMFSFQVLGCGLPKHPRVWKQEMNSRIPFYKVINKRASIFATFILN